MLLCCIFRHQHKYNENVRYRLREKEGPIWSLKPTPYTSSGGSAPALLGRVGDTPIIGSGFYAGTLGAVAITGKGEQLVRHILAFSVYQWLAEGQSMDSALQRGIDLFESTIPVGIIAVTAKA
ncbi:isoaspartyl peptidase/L-asparaginase, partial [Undibacterium sp. Di27W]|uniref:isoaspartyl peptidase/L-asparaginase n=1 Tax=Undibacterium sp. Di27W TaxID=3413036 RepID=UPI003BF0A36B